MKTPEERLRLIGFEMMDFLEKNDYPEVKKFLEEQIVKITGVLLIMPVWQKTSTRLPQGNKPIIFYAQNTVHCGEFEGNYFTDKKGSKFPIKEVTHWKKISEPPHEQCSLF